MSTLTSTTSTTRPTLGAGDVGKSYFETDTGKILVWDGTAWNLWNYDYKQYAVLSNEFTAALDGTNDYLSVPATSDFDFGTGDFSFAFWMRITNNSTYGGLFFRSTSYRLKFQGTDYTINLGMSGLDTAVITYNPGGTNTSLLNSWHHVMIIRDGSSLKGYVDNTEYGSRTLTTQSLSASGSALKWGDNSGYSVGGQLDEIAIFNRALTSSERSDIYNGGAAFDVEASFTGANAPIAFYRCGDDSNDTDSVGGAVDNGDTIGTIKNVVNPGTHDMTGVNGATYSNANTPF